MSSSSRRPPSARSSSAVTVTAPSSSRFSSALGLRRRASSNRSSDGGGGNYDGPVARRRSSDAVLRAASTTAPVALVKALLLSLRGGAVAAATSFHKLVQWDTWTGRQKFVLAMTFLLGILAGNRLTALAEFARRRTERFVDPSAIPPRYFGPTAPVLKGRAVKVTDGDTFRFYHRPTIFHSADYYYYRDGEKKKRKLTETTMAVRICTYDSPETAKFGKPGQPFGSDAKKELESILMGNDDDGDGITNKKLVSIRLLSKDQYGRVVAQVYAPSSSGRWWWFGRGRRKGVDEVMLSKGLGEVYTGSSAVYGPLGKERYVEIQEAARKSKVGMWSLGGGRESAAEYKRRTK